VLNGPVREMKVDAEKRREGSKEERIREPAGVYVVLSHPNIRDPLGRRGQIGRFSR